MPDGSEMPKTKSAKANTIEDQPAPHTQEVASAEPEHTVIVERRCRGRLGGSAFLLSLVSRARQHSRRVIPVDGDYKSETLTRHYPPGTADAAVVPKTRDGTGFLGHDGRADGFDGRRQGVARGRRLGRGFGARYAAVLICER